ncbi:uncharacterized protein FOMMEDRAFT_31318 [Fomitiporia mediterranea MF3/22]|uniref:uncharacterized protein n=1 Tax=Fomitiporia mediterranea (strain MF3/22) TaxID=694068 RepID=UPI0004408651|nr:uncharacterized protein FOMMEDRAFT_31318 [Fomitiporia mediterranea MF3/22]EJC99241.1 hypothetical protein FOMMEDRAFT_31318 [Fomitiporia mediterranea MF3/22]
MTNNRPTVNMGGNNQGINDNDPQVIYSGIWAQIQFTDPQNLPETFHSTGDSGSSISVEFNGSRIRVTGIVPPGQDNITAKYSIDGGHPVMSPVPIISQSTPLLYQQFFMSQNLSDGLHNITIDVVETGPSRNYSFQSLQVFSDIDKDGSRSNDPVGHGINAAAIVGGILGTVIFLLLCLLGAFYAWKRRGLARTSGNGQDWLSYMPYHARSVSEGSLREKAYYTPEASVIDTDSKFTFARHGGTSTNPTRSWVSVDMPPSVPQSAVVNNHISGWSSYKGSSVLVDQPQVERSRFSPYTTTTFSPMAFRESTLLPEVSRSVGRVETLASSEAPGPYESRKL